jgi:hypothetical protein
LAVAKFELLLGVAEVGEDKVLQLTSNKVDPLPLIEAGMPLLGSATDLPNPFRKEAPFKVPNGEEDRAERSDTEEDPFEWTWFGVA